METLKTIEGVLQHPIAHLVSLGLLHVLTPLAQWKAMPMYSAAVATLIGFFIHEAVPNTLAECRRIILLTQEVAAKAPGGVPVTPFLNLFDPDQRALYQLFRADKRWAAVDIFVMVLAGGTLAKTYGKVEECETSFVFTCSIPTMMAAFVKILLPRRNVAMDEVLNVIMLGSLWLLNLSTAFVKPSRDCMLGNAIWESPFNFFSLTVFQTLFDLLVLTFNLEITPLAFLLVMLAMTVRGSVLLFGHWGAMHTKHWALDPSTEPWMLIMGILVVPVLYASCLAGYLRVRMESRRIKQFLDAEMLAN